MLLSQSALWAGLCFFVCTSILLWIKWRKIGSPLIILITVVSFIYSFGIAKYSILGSMRLDSIPSAMNSETDSKFISRGEAILGSLKSWNKMLRGKKPIYITSGGSQISVDSIGDEKAIKLFKRF
ncbi:hypothetical protein [Candidatus Pseudothioglobus sp. Uisw_050_01]|uniref:hypothetical protein n=1 Tax=Candidatus Pseudothioglobus sp. Uisw_050_01 TaxID=3230997 RepID=UPI003A87C7B9